MEIKRGHEKHFLFPSSLGEEYEPLDFLGKGAGGIVFKVKERQKGEIFALKFMRVEIDDLPEGKTLTEYYEYQKKARNCNTIQTSEYYPISQNLRPFRSQLASDFNGVCRV